MAVSLSAAISAIAETVAGSATAAAGSASAASAAGATAAGAGAIAEGTTAAGIAAAGAGGGAAAGTGLSLGGALSSAAAVGSLASTAYALTKGVPKLPTPGVVTPVDNSKAISDASDAESQARQRLLAGGATSTMLTGGAGLGSPGATTSKTLGGS